MKKANPGADANPSQRITDQIAELDDWRGELLARLRQVVHEADPQIAEDWKWGSPVWADHGLVCSAGAFKDHVKLNFFKGAALSRLPFFAALGLFGALCGFVLGLLGNLLKAGIRRFGSKSVT